MEIYAPPGSMASPTRFVMTVTVNFKLKQATNEIGKTAGGLVERHAFLNRGSAAVAERDDQIRPIGDQRVDAPVEQPRASPRRRRSTPGRQGRRGARRATKRGETTRVRPANSGT